MRGSRDKDCSIFALLVSHGSFQNKRILKPSKSPRTGVGKGWGSSDYSGQYGKFSLSKPFSVSNSSMIVCSLHVKLNLFCFFSMDSPVPNMPQQRSDQHHPPGTPTMMHPATAAGPPIVAQSPAYSAQYFTCSPQQFTSQPLVQQMPHYQSQARLTSVSTSATTTTHTGLFSDIRPRRHLY